MADEREYDDDVLNTTMDETQEGDLDEYSLLPEGMYPVVIDEVKGYMHDFQNYTGAVAKLQMSVIGPEGSDNIGRRIFDQVNLPHPDEKDGNRKRRVLILSRLGLISKGDSGGQAKFDWKTLQGKKCQIEIEHKADRNDAKKIYANVSFRGYHPLNGEDAAASGDEDEFEDL